MERSGQALPGAQEENGGIQICILFTQNLCSSKFKSQGSFILLLRLSLKFQ
jgi:hypothetical protein